MKESKVVSAERKQNCLWREAECIYGDIFVCASCSHHDGVSRNIFAIRATFLQYICDATEIRADPTCINRAFVRSRVFIGKRESSELYISSTDTRDLPSTSCLPLTSLRPGIVNFAFHSWNPRRVENDVILNTYYRVKLTKAREYFVRPFSIFYDYTKSGFISVYAGITRYVYYENILKLKMEYLFNLRKKMLF